LLSIISDIEYDTKREKQ